MARGRQRDDWAEVAEGWKRSGESQRVYAARKKIAVSTLQSWIYRQPKRTASRMVEVRVAPLKATPVGRAEIGLPNGVVVRVDHGADPAWASSLVKALLA